MDAQIFQNSISQEDRLRVEETIKVIDSVDKKLNALWKIHNQVTFVTITLFIGVVLLNISPFLNEFSITVLGIIAIFNIILFFNSDLSDRFLFLLDKIVNIPGVTFGLWYEAKNYQVDLQKYIYIKYKDNVTNKELFAHYILTDFPNKIVTLQDVKDDYSNIDKKSKEIISYMKMKQILERNELKENIVVKN